MEGIADAQIVAALQKMHLSDNKSAPIIRQIHYRTSFNANTEKSIEMDRRTCM